MGIFEKKTICEICFNNDCSERGTRNICRGYNTNCCASFRKSEEEYSKVKKERENNPEEVHWSTHYDPTYRDD